eukprot:GHRR01030950.1.p1 GENE.GHRR01030950.1~~GHRR01030950.1.p1  ORF type:complete len:185 (+),score=50.77 GHRR01030950.1:424-978(+)
MENTELGAKRAFSTGVEAQAVGGMSSKLTDLVHEMESLGIVTQLAGQVVGGVAMTQSYYQHVAATEGRMGELPPCQLLITRRKGDEVTMVPVTQADLEQGHASLPRESPVLSKIMSPASLTELHWSRVPAVVVFGCFAPDETGKCNNVNNWQAVCASSGAFPACHVPDCSGFQGGQQIYRVADV